MNNKGFTLFEILIVLAVVGVLSSIVVVGYNIIYSSANEKALAAKEDVILSAALMYAEDHQLLISTRCEVNNQYADCLVITVQDLLDDGHYNAFEKCKDETHIKCVYNNVTKELMNDYEIVIYEDQYGINANFKNKISLKISQVD